MAHNEAPVGKFNVKELESRGDHQFFSTSGGTISCVFGVPGGISTDVHKITYDDNTGDLVFVTNVGASNPNALTILFSDGKVSLGEGLTFEDGVDINFNTTTGTKIGSATGEKLGLWGVTPIVQPVAATGGAMTVDQLITILQTTGIVKQS